MNQRYHALDSLRAWMMLLGIYLHVSCAYCNLPDVWWYRDAARSQFFDVTLVIIHLFRMPLFMVLAGFFGALLVTKRGVREFTRNRAMRIAVPLVGGVALLYPWMWLMGRYGRLLDKPDPLGIAWQSLAGMRWLPYINTSHLWFLNYLLWLYVGALLVRWVFRPAGPTVSRWFGAVLRSKWRLVVWPGLTFLTLCTMSVGLLDNRTTWIPAPNILLAYSVFFGFGWLLYGHRDHLDAWKDGAWTVVLVSIPLIVLNVVGVAVQFDARPHRAPVAFFVTAVTSALAVWLLTFGLVGLFLRYLNQPSKRWRYLADSAYWQYIMHSPVVLLFQLMLARSTWSPFAKCAVVTALSAAVLLVTYDLFVRSTWLGALLSGRRYPRALWMSTAGTGTANENLEPFPGSDSTQMRPLIRSTMR